MGIETPVMAVPSLAWVATLGLVGASILDRILDGENDGDDGDPLTDDGGLDDFGGEFGDDLGDDEFDEFDDDLGGGFDEFDDEGTGTDELENRLDELENEVATLSSTVSTVRSENTEISDTVQDIEEDVRNLLDIYEMVTRGINPFVDDEGFDGAVGGDGDFGLFDDAGEEDEEAELDDSVVGADAEDFFDESVVEPDETGSETTDTDMNDEGKSFSELKEEYDSGEADWADDVAVGDDPDQPDEPDDGLADDAEDGFAGDPNEPTFDSASDVGTEQELGNQEPELETDQEQHGEQEPHADPDSEGDDDRAPGTPSGQGFEPTNGRDPSAAGRSRDRNGRRERDARDARGGRRGEDEFEYVDARGMRTHEKPYLESLPADYVGDLVVMEWLEFLVSHADVTDAVRAVNYYERIEWLTPAVAERLREFLSGFGRVDLNLVDRPGTDVLTREHHTRSLRYIMQLNGATTHSILLDRWDDFASGAAFGAPGVGGDGRSAPGGARTGNGAGQSEPHAGGWSDGD